MQKTFWRVVAVAVCAAALGPLLQAASVGGRWDAEVIPKMKESGWAHVVLKEANGRITGTWGPSTIHGTLTGNALTLTVVGDAGEPAGSLAGTFDGTRMSGMGMMSGFGMRSLGLMRAMPPEEVEFVLTREPMPPAKPRVLAYNPTTFFCYYSGENKPGLHIFPGDVVHTWTPDGDGVDAKGHLVERGFDCNIGPIYVEGALPGDTLVVHLLKVHTSRATARQDSRINPHAITPAYDLAARYTPNFDGEYHLDPAKGIATLTHPSAHLTHYSVPIKPMLGCISVAPPGEERYRGIDLGSWGGNLDYNQIGEGVTLYFPVFHPGALLGFGDGHAAMGDGEVTGNALETSMDVDFSVGLIRGYHTPQVRAENKDYIMSFGVAGSVADSIQIATSQLANWIKKDYGLSDNEVALFLGAYLKYDVTELVDPHYDVVAKAPKSALALLK